jgi:hypothetical protein
MARTPGRTVVADQRGFDVSYTLTIERKAIHTRDDLSSLERRFAAAIGDGVDPDDLGWSVSSLRRAVTGLKKKGVIETSMKPPPDKAPPSLTKEAWLNPATLDATDGVVFETFSARTDDPNREVLLGGRDERFAVFCRLFKADGGNMELRTIWVKLENFHSKKEGDYTEIVHIAPVIFKAAQHQALWVEQGIVEYEDPVAWIKRQAFNDSMYSVRPGEPPAIPESDETWWQRANAAAEAIRALDPDIEFIPPAGHERPKQCARRLEAKLRMEQSHRGLE